jgi:hypothetical protein
MESSPRKRKLKHICDSDELLSPPCAIFLDSEPYAHEHSENEVNISVLYTDVCKMACPYRSGFPQQPEEGIRLERPITYRNCDGASFDVQLKGQNESMRHDWYFDVLDRFHQAGYRKEAISRIFRTMPVELETALKQGLRSLRMLKSSVNSTKTNTHQLPAMREDNYISDLEDQLWESNEKCGHIRMQYDPVTQQRRRATFNRAFARLNGFHPEETMARIAAHDMPLLATNEFDFLGGMVHYLLASRTARTERLGRMCTADGRAYLARVISMKDFDSAGRICQVCCRIPGGSAPCLSARPPARAESPSAVTTLSSPSHKPLRGAPRRSFSPHRAPAAGRKPFRAPPRTTAWGGGSRAPRQPAARRGGPRRTRPASPASPGRASRPAAGGGRPSAPRDRRCGASRSP